MTPEGGILNISNKLSASAKMLLRQFVFNRVQQLSLAVFSIILYILIIFINNSYPQCYIWVTHDRISVHKYLFLSHLKYYTQEINNENYYVKFTVKWQLIYFQKNNNFAFRKSTSSFFLLIEITVIFVIISLSVAIYNLMAYKWPSKIFTIITKNTEINSLYFH